MKLSNPLKNAYKLSIALVAVFIFGLAVTVAHAQSILPLTVAPARQQTALNPGEETTLTVKFYNQGETPIAGLLKAADFVVEDKIGSPRIIEDATQASPRFSASQWITLPYDRMSIGANDKVILQVGLKVPQNARPGGRYVAVFFEPIGAVPQAVGANEAGASIAPRLAGLIYIRVNGPITESAVVSNLFARSFSEYGPIDVEAEIINRGDYHIRPKGVVTVTSMFGGVVDQSIMEEYNIFPDAARTYAAKVGQKWMMGRYKVELAASYGEKGQVVSRSLYIVVFPWKVASVVILTLIILVLLGKNMYKGLVTKEATLEKKLEEEGEEIEKLKEQLRKKKE